MPTKGVKETHSKESANCESANKSYSLRQLCEFTYLSDNIEKHAAPNNTACAYDLKSMRRNLHPFLREIPKSAIIDEDFPILQTYCKLGLLIEEEDRFIKEPSAGGFPKLLIHLNDKDLQQLAQTVHPEVYEFNETMPKTYQYYGDTINNIPVCAIKDDAPRKIGFEKLLGCKHDNVKDEVMMYGKNKQTLFAAAKRQMKTAPAPNAKIAKQFYEYAVDQIERYLGEDLDDFSYNEAQWYSHLPAQKQRAIDPIRLYYQKAPLFEVTYTSQEKARILTEHYEAIVKAELQPIDGKPRMVCSIPQRIKYTMGPVTWQLEEIAAHKLPGYCGGKNLTEMAEDINRYLAMGFTKVVEGDGSAFDNSQDIALKAVDRYIYRRVADKVYHVPREDFMKYSQLHYKTMDVKYHINGKPKTYLTYKVLGTVFSGDCDTTLANTIRMALYNKFANDMSGLVYGQDYVLFSKGDDFSVLYNETIPDDFIKSIYQTYFLSKPTGKYEDIDDRQGGLGQICKFLEIGGPNSFKFCSLRAWYVDPTTTERITLTRDPKKLFTLSKYAIKTKNYTAKQRVKYLIDQAISYETNYPDIEVFMIMAYACRAEAARIMNNANITTDYYQHTYEKLKAKKIREYNYDFGYTEQLNERLAKLIGIKDRENFEDMVYASYWENMQARYNQRKEFNTKDELEYINQQINAEFDTEELKSLVGIINYASYN